MDGLMQDKGNLCSLSFFFRIKSKFKSCTKHSFDMAVLRHLDKCLPNECLVQLLIAYLKRFTNEGEFNSAEHLRVSLKSLTVALTVSPQV